MCLLALSLLNPRLPCPNSSALLNGSYSGGQNACFFGRKWYNQEVEVPLQSKLPIYSLNSISNSYIFFLAQLEKTQHNLPDSRNKNYIFVYFLFR